MKLNLKDIWCYKTEYVLTLLINMLWYSIHYLFWICVQTYTFPPSHLQYSFCFTFSITKIVYFSGQYAHYESGGHDLRKKKSKKTKKKSYEQHQQYISAKRKSSKQSKPSSKILDVEALKQQPKLL